MPNGVNSFSPMRPQQLWQLEFWTPSPCSTDVCHHCPALQCAQLLEPMVARSVTVDPEQRKHTPTLSVSHHMISLSFILAWRIERVLTSSCQPRDPSVLHVETAWWPSRPLTPFNPFLPEWGGGHPVERHAVLERRGSQPAPLAKHRSTLCVSS